MSLDSDIIYADNVEVVDASEYYDNLSDIYEDMPSVAHSLFVKAKEAFERIKQDLMGAPSFVKAIKSAIPEQSLQAVLTGKQRDQLAKGALKLMTKKDGSLLASLVDPKTNKIVANVPLKSVQMAPDLLQSLTDYSMQMQMAQIVKGIQEVQRTIEEVRQGQEYDRLAMAYSCQQKLLQAMEIKNPNLKCQALLQIASDAEDSRNLLMLSQKANLYFIEKQPRTMIQKMLKGSSQEKIEQRMKEIRTNLNAVNMVSVTEAMAYHEMGEIAAARQSLLYYADYIDREYLTKKGFVERLDLIDEAPDYWSKKLPEICKQIQALPCSDGMTLLEEKDDGRKSM